LFQGISNIPKWMTENDQKWIEQLIINSKPLKPN